MYSVEREFLDNDASSDYEIEFFDSLEDALQLASEWGAHVEDEDGRIYWP